jgi:hypothetical protein
MSGMDVDELARRDGEVAEGLHSLLDQMYAAVDEKAAPDVRSGLIQRGRAKLGQYEKLVTDLQGNQRDQTMKQYQSFMEELKGFIAQLEEPA